MKCSNLEVSENFKVSFSSTEKNETFGVLPAEAGREKRGGAQEQKE
jgi:hypothetical protein